MTNSTSIGLKYESIARTFLEKHNLKLIEKNYRIKGGEIDLIMTNQLNDIIFIEVKFRKNVTYGHPNEMLGLTQFKRLQKTAKHWLSANNYNIDNTSIRFDLISFSRHKDDIEWLKNIYFE